MNEGRECRRWRGAGGGNDGEGAKEEKYDQWLESEGREGERRMRDREKEGMGGRWSGWARCQETHTLHSFPGAKQEGAAGQKRKDG